MNMVYLRLALYIFGPLLGMVPGVNIDTTSMVATIDLGAAAAGIAAGGGLSAIVFKKWGKK